jgi:uncharacterized protein (TIGR03083 family)
MPFRSSAASARNSTSSTLSGSGASCYREAIDTTDLLESIEHNARLILAAARRDRLAPTLQTPGWTVGHVAAHVGRAFRWMEGMVRERVQAPTFPGPNAVAHDRLAPDLLLWFEDSLERFLATMRAADPDEPVWSWAGDNRAAFWIRLEAHEAVIHRTDAQSAFGRLDPVDAPLARDAIEGLIAWFLPGARGRSMLPCAGKLLRFEEADGEAAWNLRIDDARVALEEPAEPPDVTVRGAITDILLFLWQRVGLEWLQVEGERELVERWRELAPLP